MKERVKKIGVGVKASYHEFWRRYHNLRWSKHRNKACKHLGARRKLTTETTRI